MKNFWKKCVTGGITVFMFATCNLFSNHSEDEPSGNGSPVKIDPSIQYQTFDGFGTAMAWWGNIVGELDEPARSEIIDLVFSPTNGLGFTMCKYYIGSCENPECPYNKPNGEKHLVVGREMDGYTDPLTRLYDWNRDAAQRYVMQYVLANYNITRVEANSLTAPYYMTNSGCVSGTPKTAGKATCNLRDDCFDAFADYLTEIIKHFRDYWNIDFATISPFGEPEQNSFWLTPNNQEGCYYTVEQQDRLIKSLHASLVSKGLSTSISAHDAFNVADAVPMYKGYSAEALSYLGALGSHAYWGSLSNRYTFRDYVQSKDMYSVMTESCHWAGAKICDYQSMTPALNMAFQITTDLRDMGAKLWQAFEPVHDRCHNELFNSTWGAIQVYYYDYEDANHVLKKGDYTISKQFYGMANYTRFITQGYRIIDANDPYTLAALSPKGDLVIVTYNTGSNSKTYNFDLTKFTSPGSNVERYRTTYHQNLEKIANLSISNGSFSDILPAESITTYVISDVVYTGERCKNVNDNVVGTGIGRIEYIGSGWDYYQYPSQTHQWPNPLQATDYYQNLGLYGNDNHWSGAINNFCQIQFVGDRIRLYGAKDPSHGIGSITIDNGQEALVDYYAPSRQDNVLIYESPVLPAGQHTLKLMVTGTKNVLSTYNTITVDRFQIVNGAISGDSTTASNSTVDSTSTSEGGIPDDSGVNVWVSKLRHLDLSQVMCSEIIK